MNLLSLPEKLSCHAIYEILLQIANDHFVYIMELCYMHDKFDKTKHYENDDAYKKFWEDVDKPFYMMPYDVFKEVLREVQEMRKSYKMRAHVWRRVFFAQEKRERSSVSMLRIEVQPLKEALLEGGSITVLFCHAECTKS